MIGKKRTRAYILAFVVSWGGHTSLMFSDYLLTFRLLIKRFKLVFDTCSQKCLSKTWLAVTSATDHCNGITTLVPSYSKYYLLFELAPVVSFTSWTICKIVKQSKESKRW